MHWRLRKLTFVWEVLSNIYKVVCLSAYFVFLLFLFFFHVKALELLQGLFQPLWLVLSHLLSPVHHPSHVQCRGFFTLASRGNCSFKLLDWISPLSPEVLFGLSYMSHFSVMSFSQTHWYVLFCCFFRFEGVGIYVVMFGEIMKTLVRIVMLFMYLLLAFGLAFHALMLNQVGEQNVKIQFCFLCSLILYC